MKLFKSNVLEKYICFNNTIGLIWSRMCLKCEALLDYVISSLLTPYSIFMGPSFAKSFGRYGNVLLNQSSGISQGTNQVRIWIGA